MYKIEKKLGVEVKVKITLNRRCRTILKDTNTLGD